MAGEQGQAGRGQKAEILSHELHHRAAAADADLVEAIKNLDIKKSIFGAGQLCKPETILASNTSSISITAIAAATKRPDKFIGMHSLTPPPRSCSHPGRPHSMRPKTIAELAAAIGKEPVEVNEAPALW